MLASSAQHPSLAPPAAGQVVARRLLVVALRAGHLAVADADDAYTGVSDLLKRPLAHVHVEHVSAAPARGRQERGIGEWRSA